MKKYFILPLMLAALMFVGCNDDDDNGGGGDASPATVVGTWEVTSTTTAFEFDTLGTTFEQELSAESCTPTPLTVFNADGTLTTTDFELGTDSEGNINCEVFETLSGTYDLIQGNTYSIDVEGEDPIEVLLILSDSNNTLELRVGDDGTDDLFVIRHSRQ